MNQTVSSLMQREVCWVSADDTLQSVESTLADKGLSWIPVMDESGSISGVISSADLRRFHADGRPASIVCAWQLCTYQPIMVRPDASLSEVARLMLESNIHQVVVTDGTDIRGMVSSFDFVRTFMQQPVSTNGVAA